MKRIQDHVAVVTGAGQGLGEAFAIRLAEEGSHVAVVDIDRPLADRTAERIRSMGREAETYDTDVADWDQVQQLADSVAQRFGKVDILVNNAGMSPLYGDLVDVSEALYDKVLDVNLKGLFFCSQAAAKVMLKQDHGRIVNSKPECVLPVWARIE